MVEIEGLSFLSKLSISRDTLEAALKKYFRGKQDIVGSSSISVLYDLKIAFCATPVGRSVAHIYYDAPYSFVLTQGGVALCSVGFNEVEPGVLCVFQIQGVRGQQASLKLLRWERLLLYLLCGWAKVCGVFTELRVIRGKKHTYAANRECAFYLKYDVTAKREGFKEDKKLDCYVKKLKEPCVEAS